jgi:hypothetical protein
MFDTAERILGSWPNMSDAPNWESAIRTRLRTLMDSNLLPRAAPERIESRLGQGGRLCVACTSRIAKGETEHHILGPAIRLYFHRRCLDLLASEAQDEEAFRRALDDSAHDV